MGNEPYKVVAEAVVTKWRRLVRQQSTKIGIIADNVVLPKNERNPRKTVNTEMRTVRAQREFTKVFVEDELIKKKVEHFPIFMIAISVVQIIIFYSFDVSLLTMKFGYDPHRRHEIWRYFTCMLVHSGYSHLWGNLVMQLVLGVFLEIVHRWKRLAIIYLASVFGGSLCITVLDNAYYSVGASGGVMGLLFSHVATIVLNWSEMDRKFSRFFCVSVYIIYDVGTTIYSELYLEEMSNISHAAHFGGAITGLLVSILVLKNFKKHAWEDTMQKICVGILIAILVICFVINMTFSDYYPTNEWNFEYERTFEEDFSEESTTTETTTLYDYN